MAALAMSPVGAGSAFASSLPPHVSFSLLRSFSRPALVWPLYSSRISRRSARSRYPAPPLGGGERASLFRGFPDSSLLLQSANTQRVFDMQEAEMRWQVPRDARALEIGLGTIELPQPVVRQAAAPDQPRAAQRKRRVHEP